MIYLDGVATLCTPVGRPGERLAPLGASRDYLADPDWKRAVGTMIEDAAVTAFLLGDSESPLWEFRRTVATRGKERTLVTVPPLRDRAELGRRWTQFIHATADIIGTGLPAGLPDEPVLAFFFAHDDIIVFVVPRPGALAFTVSQSGTRLPTGAAPVRMPVA